MADYADRARVILRPDEPLRCPVKIPRGDEFLKREIDCGRADNGFFVIPIKLRVRPIFRFN